MGIGESLLQKAIASSTGRKIEAIKADLKEVGDLGLVAVVSIVSPCSRNNRRFIGNPLANYNLAELEEQPAHTLQAEAADRALCIRPTDRNRQDHGECSKRPGYFFPFAIMKPLQ